MNKIYYGNDRVKHDKIQTFRSKFEGMKMNEEEKIVDYYLRFDEIVSGIFGLGEEVEDKDMVKKDFKIFSI